MKFFVCFYRFSKTVPFFLPEADCPSIDVTINFASIKPPKKARSRGELLRGPRMLLSAQGITLGSRQIGSRTVGSTIHFFKPLLGTLSRHNFSSWMKVCRSRKAFEVGVECKSSSLMKPSPLLDLPLLPPSLTCFCSNSGSCRAAGKMGNCIQPYIALCAARAKIELNN